MRGFLEKLRSTAVSEPYSFTWSARAFHRPRYSLVSSMVRSSVPRGTLHSLLDVGCGRGYFPRYLRERGLRVEVYVGCDLDREALKEALKNGLDSAVLCDASSLPFRDGSFSAVLCSEVLEHLRRPYAAFAETARVSGAHVFLSFPYERLKNSLGFRYSEHVSAPALPGLLQVVLPNGFQPTGMRQQASLFPPSVLDRLRIPPVGPLVQGYLSANDLLVRAHLVKIAMITTFVLAFHKEPESGCRT